MNLYIGAEMLSYIQVRMILYIGAEMLSYIEASMTFFLDHFDMGPVRSGPVLRGLEQLGTV